MLGINNTVIYLKIGFITIAINVAPALTAGQMCIAAF